MNSIMDKAFYFIC